VSDIDDARLGAWLATTVPGFSALESVERFAGGQSNPTYRIAYDAGELVLRRKPFGTLLPSAHAIEREYRLLSALHPTGFPVPRPIKQCEDSEVIGAPFYVMDMVAGRTFCNGALPDVSRSERRPLYEAMIDTLARLHRLEPTHLGLEDFGKPGNYFTRQIGRWTRQYRAAQTDDIPEMESLIDWLPRTAPDQTSVAIIHGDYRIDNLIFDSHTPSVIAVLDWELATIGDPLADLTYFAMNWAMAADARAGLAGLDFAAENIPSLQDIVARYCAATDRARVPDLHWYFAYNLFRLVGIVQGVKKRLADGNASSAEAESTAARVAPLARAAWMEARLAGAQ